WILHDWSDDHCLKLLKNCYNAIPKDGKVIVVEAVVPVVPEANAYLRSITQLDVLMMAQNPGGKERTKSEFEALATKAGFSGIRYECFACNYWIMEADFMAKLSRDSRQELHSFNTLPAGCGLVGNGCRIYLA
ncbi:hypothetical protein Goari_025745, partial [Gossypium aridum]|nr:hypothetical protein [Gossypium aridum]